MDEQPIVSFTMQPSDDDDVVRAKLLTDAGGEIVIVTSREVAATIVVLLEATLARAAKRGAETTTQEAPESLVRCSAMPNKTMDGKAVVSLLLEGNHSPPLFVLMVPTDARRVSAAIAAAAEATDRPAPTKQ